MSTNKSTAVKFTKTAGKPLKQRIMDNWQLYLMLLVPVVLTIIYNLNSRLKIIHCSQSFDFSNFLQNSV